MTDTTSKKSKNLLSNHENEDDSDGSEEVQVTVTVKRRNAELVTAHAESLNYNVHKSLFANSLVFCTVAAYLCQADLDALASLIVTSKKTINELSRHKNVWQRALRHYFPYAHQPSSDRACLLLFAYLIRLKPTNTVSPTVSYTGLAFQKVRVAKENMNTVVDEYPCWPLKRDRVRRRVDIPISISFKDSLRPCELIAYFDGAYRLLFKSAQSSFRKTRSFDLWKKETRKRLSVQSYYCGRDPVQLHFGSQIPEVWATMSRSPVYPAPVNARWTVFVCNKPFCSLKSKHIIHVSSDPVSLCHYLIRPESVLRLQWCALRKTIVEIRSLRYNFYGLRTPALYNNCTIFQSGPLLVQKGYTDIVTTMDFRNLDSKNRVRVLQYTIRGGEFSHGSLVVSVDKNWHFVRFCSTDTPFLC